MNQTELKIQLDARTLHGRRFGPPGDIQALFIHGWLDNLESFTPLVPYLETTVAGISIDLTGHGASEHYPHDIHDVTVVDWVIDILAACEHISEKPLLLVGHSLGGGLCTMAAGLMPERVKGLVLLDGIVPIPAEESEFCTRFRMYLEAKKKAMIRGDKVYTDLTSVIEARLKAGDVSRESATRIVTRNVALHKQGFLWSTDPRLKLPTVNRLTHGQLMSVVQEVRCRTVLFKALKREMQIDDALFEVYARSIRNIEIFEVNTSHYVHADIPEKVAQIIQEFLVSTRLVYK